MKDEMPFFTCPECKEEMRPATRCGANVHCDNCNLNYTVLIEKTNFYPEDKIVKDTAERLLKLIKGGTQDGK